MKQFKHNLPNDGAEVTEQLCVCVCVCVCVCAHECTFMAKRAKSWPITFLPETV